MNFFANLLTGILLFSTTLFGGVQATVNSPALGSAVPQVQALFETSLQASITSNATSATMVSGTDFAGNALNGYYCFTVDSGQPNVEFMCGNASGTALTNLVRGVNPVLGISSNTALEYSHRRGADVKQTDAPYISLYSSIFNGSSSIPGDMIYDHHPTNTASTTIEDKNYIDNSVVAGGVPATVSVPGITPLSTGAQMASGTPSVVYNSLTYSYIPQNKNFSSVASTSPIGVVASGTLDPSFLLNGNYSLGSTTAQSLTSASTTLNGTTTVTNTTSSILSTNASGIVSGLQGTATGTLLQFYNGQWNAGMYHLYLATSTTIASSSNLLLQTIPLPQASTNSIYSIAFGLYDTNTHGYSTTTLVLYGGGASTTIATCGLNNNSAPISLWLQGTITMQNSTSSEFVSVPYISSSGCTPSVTNYQQFLNLNLASNPSIQIYGTESAGTETLNSTSSITISQ